MSEEVQVMYVTQESTQNVTENDLIIELTPPSSPEVIIIEPHEEPTSQHYTPNYSINQRVNMSSTMVNIIESRKRPKSHHDTPRPSTIRLCNLSSDEVILIERSATPISANSTTVSNLPEEVLLMIFEYLGHMDLLNSRLVDTRWNNIISNFFRFPNTKMIYVVNQGADKESQVTLNKSEVPWKLLRLAENNFYQPFTLPLNQSATVKSLEIAEPIISWSDICKILVQFKILEEFRIVKCELGKEPLTKKSKAEVFENLVESVKKLRSIFLEMRKIVDMTTCIRELNLLNVSNLVNISIKEDTTKYRGNNGKNTQVFFAALLELIQKSAWCLKTLRINFKSSNPMNNFFSEVLEKLIGLVDLHTLKLKRFKIEDSNKKDMQILSRFVLSQKNLKLEIHLSKTVGAKSENWAKFLPSVNKNVKKIHVPSGKYMRDDFFDYFSNLSKFTCDFKLEHIFKKCKKQSYPEMQSLKYQNFCDVPLITLRFPNLTKLTLDKCRGKRYTFFDADLQVIIQHLKKLKFLVIGDCSKVTDFGISGVNKDFCMRLYEGRTLISGGEIVRKSRSLIRKQVEGSPISSLMGLAHLTLNGAINFTDVGIFYGFRFKELRYLRMTEGNNNGNRYITDWGFEWLAKWNPDLEKAYLGYGDFVTQTGLRKVRGQLRRIKDKNVLFKYDPLKADDDNYSLDTHDVLNNEFD